MSFGFKYEQLITIKFMKQAEHVIMEKIIEAARQDQYTTMNNVTMLEYGQLLQAQYFALMMSIPVFWGISCRISLYVTAGLRDKDLEMSSLFALRSVLEMYL